MKILLYNTFYCKGLGRYRGQTLSEFFRLFKHCPKTLEEIGNFLRSHEPDIIGLVEISDGNRSHVNYLAQKTGCTNVAYRCKYANTSIISRLPLASKKGNAILSKEQYISTVFREFSAGSKRLVIQTVYKEFSLFLVHLSLRKWKREKQLEELSEMVNQVDQEVIVMGDFNATDMEDLKELATKNKLSFVNQYGEKTFPSFKPRKRLDYILISPGINIKDFEVLKVKHSDHLPLLLEFEVENNK